MNGLAQGEELKQGSIKRNSACESSAEGCGPCHSLPLTWLCMVPTAPNPTSASSHQFSHHCSGCSGPRNSTTISHPCKNVQHARSCPQPLLSCLLAISIRGFRDALTSGFLQGLDIYLDCILENQIRLSNSFPRTSLISLVLSPGVARAKAYTMGPSVALFQTDLPPSCRKTWH